MRISWTEAALADLDEILDYTSVHSPTAVTPLLRRVDAVLARISSRPESARRVLNRTGVRIVPLIRYPFKIYYQIETDRILILHIHHTSRQPWAE